MRPHRLTPLLLFDGICSAVRSVDQSSKRRPFSSSASNETRQRLLRKVRSVFLHRPCGTVISVNIRCRMEVAYRQSTTQAPEGRQDLLFPETSCLKSIPLRPLFRSTSPYPITLLPRCRNLVKARRSVTRLRCRCRPSVS